MKQKLKDWIQTAKDFYHTGDEMLVSVLMICLLLGIAILLLTLIDRW